MLRPKVKQVGVNLSICNIIMAVRRKLSAHAIAVNGILGLNIAVHIVMAVVANRAGIQMVSMQILVPVPGSSA